MRVYSDQLYTKKIDNLKEMDKLLEMYNLPRLNHKEIILNTPITSKETESVITPNKEETRTR